MKKIAISLAALFLIITPIVHADPVGDVTARPGQAAFSAGYYYENAKPEIEFSGGAMVPDWTSHQIYAEGAFGFANGWDAFIRVGNASLETNALDGATFEDAFNPYLSAGIRGSLAITKQYAIGVFAKFNYYGDWSDKPINNNEIKIENNYDFMAGLTAKMTIQNATLYTGPLYFQQHSEMTVKGDHKIENKDNLGFLFGAKFPVGPDVSINAEAQYKADALSAGLFASYSF